MKLFNDQAAAAVASLDSADAAYCAKLEQRFAHMGISSKAASSAVQSLVEADAVPQVGVWAALPSAFKGLFQKKTEAKPVASEAFEASLSEALAKVRRSRRLRFAAWCHLFVGPVLPRLHLSRDRLVR